MKVQNRRKSKYQLGGYQAAPVQLTPAQLQAQRAEALRQQQINSQRNAATLPTPDARSYGPRIAKYGGIKYGNGGLPAYGVKRKFAVGGSMYGDNTVQSAGQGAAGSTSNIVYQENSPELQIQRQEALNAQTKEVQESGKVLEQEVAQDDAQTEIDIQNAEDKVTAMSNTASAGIKSGIELGKKSGIIDKKSGSLGFGEALKAYKGVRAAKNTVKSIEGFNKAKTAFDMSQRIKMGESAYKMSQIANNVKNLKIGTEGMKTGIQGFSGAKQGLDVIKTGSELTSMGKDGLLVASDGAKALSQGSAVGSGLSALNNVNVYAAAANYAGKGIKKLSDDNDATTWTAGEGFGDTLSKAGEYAGYGAMLGSVVPGVGNAIGAAVGGIVGTGVGLYQGLTGRGKARKAEALAKAEKKEKVDKYNTELGQNFGSQMSRINAGRMKQKTYSGYDLGQNVIAKRGGYRNMPQYI